MDLGRAGRAGGRRPGHPGGQGLSGIRVRQDPVPGEEQAGIPEGSQPRPLQASRPVSARTPSSRPGGSCANSAAASSARESLQRLSTFSGDSRRIRRVEKAPGRRPAASVHRIPAASHPDLRRGQRPPCYPHLRMIGRWLHHAFGPSHCTISKCRWRTKGNAFAAYRLNRYQNWAGMAISGNKEITMNRLLPSVRLNIDEDPSLYEPKWLRQVVVLVWGIASF